MNEVKSAFSVYSKQQKKSKQKTLPKMTNAKTRKVNKIKKTKLESRIKKSVDTNPVIVENLKEFKENGKKENFVSVKKKKVLKTKSDKKTREKIPKLVKSPRKEESENTEVICENPFIEASNDYTHSAVKLLKWFLYPLKRKTFFENYWEIRHVHVKRNIANYFNHILSSSQIDKMLREHPLYFGRNVDIVRYENDVRETVNPAGRAKASIVWDAYGSGHSIRILNPQTYNKNVQIVLSALQEYFGAMVGANVYLTPAGSQGFAPHYDDIEAFVIQLEGRKHWKLYSPKESGDILARFSSKDFKREDLGELISEVTLNPGDILYFPRGVVHEAKTDEESHSLHMTISTYQRTAFVDLLEKILPDALARAASEDIEFRQGLPIGYLKHLGVVNVENNTTKRFNLIDKIHHLVGKLGDYIDIDNAADQMGRKFMHEAIPPVLDKNETFCTSEQDGDEIENGQIVYKTEIEPDTEIRLLRYFSIRLVIENGQANVYFSTQNSKVYQGEEEQFMTIDMDLCPIVQFLLQCYPEYVNVENLPHNDLSKKVGFVTELWDYGIIVTKNPLKGYDV